MIVHAKTKSLLLKLNNLDRVTTVIPTAKANEIRPQKRAW